MQGIEIGPVESKPSSDLGWHEYFDNFKRDPDVKAVVCGLDMDITYHKICVAALYLQTGAEWILTNEDAFTCTRTGLRLPGNGSVTKPLENCLKKADGGLLCEKTCTGKPNRAIVDLIMAEHGIAESERDLILMVGDNPETDIALANNSGIKSCQVLSGCLSSEEEVAHWNAQGELYRATHVVANIGEPLFE